MYKLIIFILLFETINCAKTKDKLAKKQKPLAKLLRGGDESLGPHLDNYFNGDGVKLFDKAWNQYQIPLESYITNVLQDGYTRQVLPSDVNTKISGGFYVSDSTVDVLFQDMYLRELPYISSKVHLWVPFNYLSLMGHTMNKIFIDTNYILFRNQCDIRFGKGVDNPAHYSPFTLNQVQERGPVTLIAEDCRVNGTVIVSLNGPSVALRHSTLSLEQCAFSVEISSPGQGLPPVIAPYFSAEKRRELMRLINKPLRDALNARLETILYSNIVNEQLYSQANETNFKDEQKQIFKASEDFVTAVLIKNLNNMTITKNIGTLMLPDSTEIKVTKKENKKPNEFRIKVYDVILQGLESAYSPNVGGPFKSTKPMILDSIIFYSLVAHGKMAIKNGTDEGLLTFSAELKHVSADITFNFYKDDPIVSVTGWRDLDYFMYDLSPLELARDTANAMLIGYLSQEVPPTLEKYLREMIPEILSDNIKHPHSQDICFKPKKDSVSKMEMNNGDGGATKSYNDDEEFVKGGNPSIDSPHSRVAKDTDESYIATYDDNEELQQDELNLTISFNDLTVEFPDPPVSTTKRSKFWFDGMQQNDGADLYTENHHGDDQSSINQDNALAKTIKDTIATYRKNKLKSLNKMTGNLPHVSSLHKSRAKGTKRKIDRKLKQKLKKQKYSNQKIATDSRHKIKKVRFSPVPIHKKKKKLNLSASDRPDLEKRSWIKVYPKNYKKQVWKKVETSRE